MFKENLVRVRKEYDLTQQEVATRLQMSRTGYASWEQGLAEPSLESLKKICLSFNVSADELLDLADNQATAYQNPTQQKMIRAKKLHRELIGILNGLPDSDIFRILGYAESLKREKVAK